MEYKVKIDEFEGPLDLLLHLIKESNINIQDIDICVITEQYLDYINKMEELNINIAGNYLVMAAELIEIKSKSLLPKVEEEESFIEDEISKENLINKLIEYQKYKDMIESFKDMEMDRQKIYVKAPEKIDNYIDNVNEGEGDINLLVEAFKGFLERLDREKPLSTKITNREYSVKKRKSELRDILGVRKRVNLVELFDIKSRDYIVVTFLSILEMTKDKEVVLSQDSNFRDILVEVSE